MKLIATVALTLALTAALAPRPTQAGDVERVQRACAELRTRGNERAGTAIERFVKTQNGFFVLDIVDARLRDVFCK